MLRIPVVSDQRRRDIVRDIASSSQPKGRFFVLLITASMIASFGLIANSTAVIIGAMLVSPLMTPIFGVALGMLRGNPPLVLRALSSEALGVALAVASAYLIGLPQLTFIEATPEMLSRTQPNLLDLLVAIFAGFAGAYALIDERVSPALPGVAIATAIVPPLSTCGLCLSLGAWSGAGGAMLLFLANFVSILLVALATFWAGGLRRSRPLKLRRLIRYFGPTAALFVAITIILTNSLWRIMHERNTRQRIHQTLTEKLDATHGAELDDVKYSATSRGVQVLATVRSHRTISPAWVKAIRDALQQSLASDVDLVVRTIRSRDVSPLGSSLQVVRPDQSGRFIKTSTESVQARESLASQVIREVFEKEPGFELTRVEYGRSPLNQAIVLAYVNAIRRLAGEEIESVEQLLRDRFSDPHLSFYIRVNAESLQDREGPVRAEWINIVEAGPDEIERLPQIKASVHAAIEQTLQLVPLHTHFHWADGRWRALVEVIGAKNVGADDVKHVHAALPDSIKQSVEVLIWRRTDFIATQTGLTTYDRLTAPLIRQQSQKLRQIFQSEAVADPAVSGSVRPAANTRSPNVASTTPQ